MSWVSVALELDQAQAGALADALLELGAVCVDIVDADAGTERETPVFDQSGEPSEICWDRARISALFGSRANHRQVLHAACKRLGLPVPAEVQLQAIPDQDWVAAAHQQFNPTQVSPRLWVVPSWAEPPDPNAFNLRLDPGLAFGTGTHPTTRQCLLWLDSHLRSGWSVLDYGSGSGILAIAAKKLGGGRVVGVDIDPNAIDVSVRNAALNQVEAEFTLADALGEDIFDVVIANLLANPLRVLAPLLAARARPAGWIVLAGVLERQAAAVREAYANWVELAPVYPCEGWTCLSGTRRE